MTHACIVVHRMASHNHLPNLNFESRLLKFTENLARCTTLKLKIRNFEDYGTLFSKIIFLYCYLYITPKFRNFETKYELNLQSRTALNEDPLYQILLKSDT